MISKVLPLHRPHRAVLETSKTRLLIVSTLLFVLFALVMWRVIAVTLVSPLSPPVSSSLHHVSVRRGDIVDRNGVLLATSLRTLSLYTNPSRIKDPEGMAKSLASVLPHLNPQGLARRLASRRHFAWIRHGITPEEQRALFALRLPHLRFKTSYSRVYTEGPLFSHTVGFTNLDHRGLTGLERGFDRELKKGKTVRLTLDARIQYIVHEELAKAQESLGAKAAVGIVMNASNSEVLSLVSLPDFDPNHRNSALSDSLFSRATLGAYESGSVMKIFTMALALEKGTATLKSVYDASHPLRVTHFTIHDADPQNRPLSVPEIFIYSSNIGAALMASSIGPEAQKSFMKTLGFLNPLSVALQEVARPLYPHIWRPVTAMTVAFGYGLAISPLQLIAGVSSMVNGGMFYAPTFRLSHHLQGRRIISAHTSRLVRALMRLNVLAGTGYEARVPGYNVGGKTGTTKKISPDGGYSSSVRSSFVATFPSRTSRYVVYALLDDPQRVKDDHWSLAASQTVTPLVGKVIKRIAPLLGITPVLRAPADHGLCVMVRPVPSEPFESRVCTPE